MDGWLYTFAGRVPVGIGVFAAAGLSTLVVAWLAISYQSACAALTDPVVTLRCE